LAKISALLFFGANSFSKSLFLKSFSAKHHIFILLALDLAGLQRSVIAQINL